MWTGHELGSDGPALSSVEILSLEFGLKRVRIRAKTTSILGFVGHFYSIKRSYLWKICSRTHSLFPWYLALDIVIQWSPLDQITNNIELLGPYNFHHHHHHCLIPLFPIFPTMLFEIDLSQFVHAWLGPKGNDLRYKILISSPSSQPISIYFGSLSGVSHVYLSIWFYLFMQKD